MSDPASQPLKVSAKQRKRVLEGADTKERFQCEFVIEKKNRRCPLTRKRDVLYCAQHLKERDGEQRVHCPLNPKHTVWSSDLKSHLKKCEKLQEASTDPWVKKDYNFGERIDPVEYIPNFQHWIPLVNKVYEEYEPLVLELEAHDGVESRLKEKQNQKHPIQQSSLIGQLHKNGLLSSNLAYVEFGCGRAELSRYVLQSVMHQDGKTSDFILIDRSPTRLKMDAKIHKDAETRGLTPPQVFRAKMDIKDLYIDAIVSSKFPDSKFVGISKHLCGAATDLTIKCLLNNELLMENFQGMIIAMCCRHVCDYSQLHLHSRKYLTKRGIDQQGFKHLTKFASWAVNGRRKDALDTDGADHLSGLNISEREQLGLKARRIIDESRRHVLQNEGLNARLVNYVTKDISLENTCMVVTKVK